MRGCPAGNKDNERATKPNEWQYVECIAEMHLFTHEEGGDSEEVSFHLLILSGVDSWEVGVSLRIVEGKGRAV